MSKILNSCIFTATPRAREYIRIDYWRSTIDVYIFKLSIDIQQPELAILFVVVILFLLSFRYWPVILIFLANVEQLKLYYCITIYLSDLSIVPYSVQNLNIFSYVHYKVCGIIFHLMSTRKVDKT